MYSCPGEPDPSFFHDDEIENKKKEKNTQKKQEKEKEEQNRMNYVLYSQ